MTKRAPSSADVAVETAIDRVLAAEREARDAVDAATRDAAAMIEAARGASRAVAMRSERRIRTLRETFAARAAREIAAIDAEVALQDVVRELSEDDLTRLERSVAAVAGDLTSGSP